MTGRLGPYQVRSELGRGAMAVVWRAHDPVLERDVAIKEPMLPRGVDAASSAEFGARFVREAKAAARLNHPNIVTIYAADNYDGHPAIVMELVEGETLGQILTRGPLEPRMVRGVIEQLLSAVGYAHERGIVHRDIKPDNIFLTPEGRVKLTDFGIASLATNSTLTQAGAIMGTPGYMAPEQITGGTVDARADIFAVGVLAYEMLTGQNPFGASAALPITTVMYRIVHQDPPEIPAEILTGQPGDMRRILEVALAKGPVDRFPNAQSFLAALKGEGPLPVSGAAGAPVVGRQGGTVATRLSAIKSATIISRAPAGKQEAGWLKSWVPYAAVVLVGLIVMVALLVSAKSGGSGVMLAAGEATTAASVEGSSAVVGDPSGGATVAEPSWSVAAVNVPSGASIPMAIGLYVEDRGNNVVRVTEVPAPGMQFPIMTTGGLGFKSEVFDADNNRVGVLESDGGSVDYSEYAATAVTIVFTDLTGKAYGYRVP